MRRVTIAYTIIATWLFGWLTGTFGFLPALLAALIFVSPGFFAWRMTRSRQPVKRREYVYLAVVTTLALFGTAFIIVSWYAYGLDKLAMLDREIRAFRRGIATMPEFSKVEVSYTLVKGGRVSLDGWVGAKKWHDQLVEMATRMFRNNEGGIFDRVTYPREPVADTSQQELPRNAHDEQMGPAESSAELDSNGLSSTPAR
jgi:hypothetical protein